MVDWQIVGCFQRYRLFDCSRQVVVGLVGGRGKEGQLGEGLCSELQVVEWFGVVYLLGEEIRRLSVQGVEEVFVVLETLSQSLLDHEVQLSVF